MNRLVHRMRGQLHIRVQAPFPERVLNLCSAHGLSFWDLSWDGPTCFTCRMARGDYPVLCRAAENLEAQIQVVRQEGAPYFFRRLRHRQLLAVGVVLGTMLLFLSSFFVWDIQIEGNETVPAEQILRALETCGVQIGSFGLSLDGEDIRNHVLLDIPELSWITVNVSGCRAEVQVRERIFPPEMVDIHGTSNVVARRAGLVEQIQVRGGVAAVRRGSAVSEGQLLISGVEDTSTYGARLLPGMGSVQARTWYTLTVPMSLQVREKQYTGQKFTGFSLIFGTQRIKFFSNSSIEGKEYDKMKQRYPLTLFGLPLPLTLEREVYTFYDVQSGWRTAQQAQSTAEALLQAYLTQLIVPYGQVVSTLCTASEQNGVLTVMLRAECREEIGQSVPIYTEETAEGGARAAKE